MLTLYVFKTGTISGIYSDVSARFSQEGVQPSYECPFLEELKGKIHLISYNFMGKHSFWTASFQCLAKSLQSI